MDQNQIEALIDAARNIRQHAYCPYSHFPVGCALLGQDGKLFTGVNVENVSFGATNCAERSALFTAASLGYRPGFIKAIAVAGATEDFLPPCSICRQVLVEWADPETPVFLTRNDGQIKQLKLLDLAPYAFTQMN